MKLLFCTVLAAVPCLVAPAFAEEKEKPATPEAGKQVAQSVEVTGSKDAKKTVRYWLALPPAAETKPADGWPLMLFMHGAGERGDDLNMVKKHGPPKLAGDMPVLNKFIIVSPQCPSGDRWDPAAMKGLIDHIAKTQPVDKNRIIVTGLSMGGYATWDILAAYPDLPAAAVPICGKGDPSKAERFKHVPIKVFHGSKDEAVPLKHSDDMVAALKKAGGKPDYTIYEGVGHDSWTQTYAEPKLFEWMLEQKKAK